MTQQKYASALILAPAAAGKSTALARVGYQIGDLLAVDGDMIINTTIGWPGAHKPRVFEGSGKWWDSQEAERFHRENWAEIALNMTRHPKVVAFNGGVYGLPAQCFPVCVIPPTRVILRNAEIRRVEQAAHGKVKVFPRGIDDIRGNVASVLSQARQFDADVVADFDAAFELVLKAVS